MSAAGARATLVYGIPVDPYNLLYSARAWSNNQLELKYLDGLVSGELLQDTTCGRSLPNELLEMVKRAYWDSALRETTCRAWILFGEGDWDGCRCKEIAKGLREEACEDWGNRGSCDDFFPFDDADFGEAEYEFCDHFPSGCMQSDCQNCQVLKPFMKAHDVVVAHCSQQHWQPTTWIIAGAAGKHHTHTFSTGHELQDGVEETALELSLSTIQSHTNSGERLIHFVSKYDIATEAFPGIAREKALKERAGNVKTQEKAELKEKMKAGPRLFLIASSWCW